MGKYFLKRILWLIPTVLCVGILIFSLMHFVPGDPATQLLGVEATKAEIEAKRAELGLDKPFVIQLGTFLYNTFIRFDFGNSYISKAPIGPNLAQRLVRTTILGTIGSLIGMGLGLVLGVSAAVHANHWQDRVCILISLVGVSMPSFWLALMLMLLFVVKIRLLPSSAIMGWTGWILPCLSVGLSSMATFARQVRSSMLEVIRADYVTTASAKGLPKRDVIYKHALPNAMVPILSIFGLYFASLFAGSIVIETIFGIPGIGLYLVSGINSRDYPVVQSCVIVVSFIVCAVLILVDLIYALVDPRIKARYSKGRRRK
ncbi:MAG: ABC transporter permease [Spirochaetales bacterium]|nr:ABC transporter permease [Spirochaetales bacterium]